MLFCVNIMHFSHFIYLLLRNYKTNRNKRKQTKINTFNKYITKKYQKISRNIKKILIDIIT